MSAAIRIKDWRKFQHYKHRDPPWIRIYRKLLDDREWHSLDGEAGKMLINLWLLASESDGKLPSFIDIAFRLHTTEKEVSKAISNLGHWLEYDASTPLAERYQDALPETETETETYLEDHKKRKGRKGNSRKAKTIPLPEGWCPPSRAITIANSLPR